MSLTLTRMRELVRKGLGNLSTDNLSDDEVDEYLNMSLWALEDKYPFRTREKNTNTNLVIGQYIYDLSGITRLDAIESVAVAEDPEKRRKLARIDRNWWDANFELTNRGTPERYFRENNCIYVYPVPDEVLPLEIKHRQGVASLAASNTTTGLPRSWDEIVVQGAIYRGHYYNEDYDQAQKALNFQIGLIKNAVPVEAKEEADSRYARVQVLTEWPDDFEDF